MSSVPHFSCGFSLAAINKGWLIDRRRFNDGACGGFRVNSADEHPDTVGIWQSFGD
jgi:hypothetical protein